VPGDVLKTNKGEGAASILVMAWRAVFEDNGSYIFVERCRKQNERE
jgi:hypothetical protein